MYIAGRFFSHEWKGVTGSMDKKVLKTYFFCVIGTLLIAFLLWKWKDTATLIRSLLHAFRPVIMGVVFAALLNRPFEWLRRLYRWAFPKLRVSLVRVFAVITLYLLLFGLLAGLLVVVLPQLYQNIERFLANLEGYYQNITRSTESLLSFGGRNWWEELHLEDRLQDLISYLPTLLQKASANIAQALAGLIGTITDATVGIVISIYGLLQKEKLAKQTKRILRAIVGGDYYARTVGFFSLFSRTFSNFFSGQLTEALILGVLCFIGMKLFGFDYGLLVSVITGLTNLVPVLGPIVGAIPCAFILFLTEPNQAIWFLLFIIILQQLEANLIYPKVVGDSVGLPGVWVLISVIVGGSLFGIAGMLFAIPTVSVGYQLIKEYVIARTEPDPPEDGKRELAVFSKEEKLFSEKKGR